MSPELFDPEIRDNSPTKHSDCYALGMVIYEVLSGHIPFYRRANLVVPGLIFAGERPERPEGPEGVWFTDDVWAVLERCWAHQPDGRPGVEDVLWCLEEVAKVWTPPSLQAVASPSTTDSPTRNPFRLRTEPNTDGGEVGHFLSTGISLAKVANWDGKSQDIHQVLVTAFEASDYLDCVKDLRAQNIEPLSYVNSLDKVSSRPILGYHIRLITAWRQIIDNLPTNSDLRMRCIRALRKTCGLHGVLPISHIVTFTLSQPRGRPYASGGFSDVWKLTDEEHPDRVFAVKSLRVHEQDPVDKVNKVRGPSICKSIGG